MSKVTYDQPGYIGCSMSENAARAYSEGEKPASRWTKSEMLYAINRRAYALGVDPRPLFSLTKQELFDAVFRITAYHHTGKYANETAFFDVSDNALLNALEDMKEARA